MPLTTIALFVWLLVEWGFWAAEQLDPPDEAMPWE